jgi:hypothetical protein
MSANNIQESLFKTTSVAYSENIAKERGWKIAPKDHPIYSEGSSIMFLNPRPKQSQKNDTVTPSLTHRSRSIK